MCVNLDETQNHIIYFVLTLKYSTLDLPLAVTSIFSIICTFSSKHGNTVCISGTYRLFHFRSCFECVF